MVFLEFDKRDIMMFIHPWIYYHFSTVLDVVQPWSTTGCCRYALCLNNVYDMVSKTAHYRLCKILHIHWEYHLFFLLIGASYTHLNI